MVGEDAHSTGGGARRARAIGKVVIGRVLGARTMAPVAPSPEFYAGDVALSRGTMGGGLAIDTAPHFVRATAAPVREFTAVTATFGTIAGDGRRVSRAGVLKTLTARSLPRAAADASGDRAPTSVRVAATRVRS